MGGKVTKKIDKFTKEEIEQAFKESNNWAMVAEKLGYSKFGGSSRDVIQSYANENNIDTSHFTGQGWSKGKVDLTRFRKGVPFSNLRESLLNIRQHQCERCKNTEWFGKEIPLEVHNIDGNRLNNELNNLQLLCPNCHAQTENWKGKNVNHKKEITDEQLIEALKNSLSISEALRKVGVNYMAKSWFEKARQLMLENNIDFPKREVVQKEKKERKKRTIKYCSKCGKELYKRTKGNLCRECLSNLPYRRYHELPEKEQLEKEIYKMSFSKIGDKYGVTGNSIRKWCKHYGLPYRRADIDKILTSCSNT